MRLEGGLVGVTLVEVEAVLVLRVRDQLEPEGAGLSRTRLPAVSKRGVDEVLTVSWLDVPGDRDVVHDWLLMTGLA